MPRLRRAIVETPECPVPGALLDPTHQAWQSQETANDWRLTSGLSVAGVDTVSPLTRHLWAVGAWAEQQSITTGPWERVDVERLAQMGVEYSPAKAAQERLRLTGMLYSDRRADH